jgi:solute carrier family 45 protein 1/2/4
MGREVYQGDPKGDIVKATSYQRGVQEGAFGLLLNSVILGISSLFIDPLCRLLGSKNVWALGNFIVFVAMAFTGIITMNVVHSRADGSYHHPNWVRIAAVILFTVLGFPLAITYSVPYSLTADLTADAGAGQGLAMGILNLAVVIPQTLVALGSGPWDALFGGGNEPAFALASISALAAGIIAFRKLPMLSRNGYQRTTMMHGPH